VEIMGRCFSAEIVPHLVNALGDDDDCNALQFFGKCLAQQGVKAIIGHMTSGMAELTVPFTNANRLLLISPTISTDDLTGRDDYFLRVIPSNAVQGRNLAKTAAKVAGAHRITVIFDALNDSFARPIIAAFDETFRAEGGGLVRTESFTGQGDFERLVQLLQQTDTDGILLIASASDAGMFCQHQKKAGLDLPVFLPMWAMTNDFIAMGGAAVEGAYLISQEDSSSENPAYQRFRQRYSAKHGMEPTFAAILSYEATMVLAEGMRSAKELSAEGIKAAIIETKTFQGLQQPIVIDRFGDAAGSYYLYRVQGGAFVKVGPL